MVRERLATACGCRNSAAGGFEFQTRGNGGFGAVPARHLGIYNHKCRQGILLEPSVVGQVVHVGHEASNIGHGQITDLHVIRSRVTHREQRRSLPTTKYMLAHCPWVSPMRNIPAVAYLMEAAGTWLWRVMFWLVGTKNIHVVMVARLLTVTQRQDGPTIVRNIRSTVEYACAQ